MGELRFHAIAITEIRDMFGASPELAAQLRTIASERFSVPLAENRPKASFFSKIGPFRRNDPTWDVTIPVTTPSPNDWENLIHGRYIAPERVDASWRALDAWVDAFDFDTLTVSLSSSQLDELDFELTKAGLPSQFSIRHLMHEDPMLGLRAGADMRIGYSRHAHVLATRDALAGVVNEVEEPYRDAARLAAEFLDGFDDYTDRARAAGRPAPDLFVVWWHTRLAQPTTATAE